MSAPWTLTVSKRENVDPFFSLNFDSLILKTHFFLIVRGLKHGVNAHSQLDRKISDFLTPSLIIIHLSLASGKTGERGSAPRLLGRSNI